MQDKKDTILIISGDNACFNALNEFATAFSIELNSLGCKTEVRDICQINTDILDDINRENFRAIVGFQTNMFTLRLPDGRLIGDILHSPKYNFVFDPPASKLSYFSYDDPGMNLLLSDHGYISFINSFFPGKKKVHFLPPGGGLPQISIAEPDYKSPSYDLTFMGTYNNYRDILKNHALRFPDFSEITLDFFQYLVEHPNNSAEYGILDYLSIRGIALELSEILSLFEILYGSELAAISYYRERVIRTILDHGIKLDVFSSSWYNSPFADNANLTIHEPVPYRDSFQLLEQSKLSLNLFSWHKNAMTERIANIMIGGAACVSDVSIQLNDYFRNNEDMIIFNLNDIDHGAEMIAELLSNDSKRIQIAQNGHEIAVRDHQWKNRAESFMHLLNE